MPNSVLAGFVTAWRLAGWPTRRSPSPVTATMEGVVLAPSVFSMTLGSLPSITATQELVVPRSIPITLLMKPVPTREANPDRLPMQRLSRTPSMTLKNRTRARPPVARVYMDAPFALQDPAALPEVRQKMPIQAKK